MVIIIWNPKFATNSHAERSLLLKALENLFSGAYYSYHFAIVAMAASIVTNYYHYFYDAPTVEPLRASPSKETAALLTVRMRYVVHLT